MAPSISVSSMRSFRRPPSPTGSATTSASAMDFGGDDGPRIVVTRADLRASVAAYEGLLATAKAYRNALLAVSTATTAFAGALEECARVKGAGESGDQLLAASGLQYMIANSNSVLSDTLYRQFEIPLLHAYDSYVSSVSTRHAEYEALLATRTAEIRQTEADNLKQGRKKSRDLSQFRQALEKLQEQVREVEICKRSYYSETLEHETETWGMIGGKVALLLRSTLDLADRLSSKATSDPVIELMLAEHPDPFDSYRPESEEDRDVFTILPPLGMNLNLGPSKRGSVIDIGDKDSDGHSDSATLTTPRQHSLKKSASAAAAEVLGLNDDAPEGPASPSPKPGLSTGRQSGGGNGAGSSAPARNLPSRLHLPHLPASQSSTVATHSPSPPASPEDRDSNASSSAPHPTSSSSTSSLSKRHLLAAAASASNSSRRPSRRELSRVSEQESDPMAGDWDPPQFGRTLSPAINGNGGDDFDSGGEDADGGHATSSAATESPKSARRSLTDDGGGSPGPWA